MKRTLPVLLLLAGLSLWSAGAHAAPALFGIEMGMDVQALPECEHDTLVHKELCWRDPQETDPTALSLYYPSGSLPRYLSEIARAHRLGGKIVAVNFRTNGTRGQEPALSTLTGKFGKPNKLAKRELQNAFGARFQGSDASWKLAGGYAVDFGGIDGDLEWGHIELVSPEWDTEAVQRDARKAARKIAP